MYHTIVTVGYICVAMSAGFAVFYWSLARSGRNEIGFHPLALAMSMTVTAFIAPRVEILYGVSALAPLVFARKRERLAAVYIVILFILPVISTPIIISGVNLLKINVQNMASLGAVLVIIFSGKRGSPGFASDTSAVLIVLLYIIMMGRDTTGTNFARVALQTILDLGIPYWIISRSIRDSNDAAITIRYIVSLGCIISSILILETGKSWPIYRILFQKFEIFEFGEIVKFRDGNLRATGPFLEATSMALFMVLPFLVAWNSRKLWKSSTAHAFVLAWLVIGIACPQSRNAWVGLIIGLVASSFYDRPTKKVKSPIQALILLAFLAAGLLAIINHLFAPAEGDALNTVNYRKQLLSRGIEEFWKNPLFGDNIITVTNNMIDLRQGEGIVDFVNSYLFVSLSSGIIGLSVYIFALILPIFLLLKKRNIYSDIHVTSMKISCFAIMAGMIVMLAFTSNYGLISVVVMVAIGLSSASLNVKFNRKFSKINYAIDVNRLSSMGGDGQNFDKISNDENPVVFNSSFTLAKILGVRGRGRS